MITPGMENPAPSLQPAAQPKSSAYVVRIAVIAALGGLLFGYDWL